MQFMMYCLLMVLFIAVRPGYAEDVDKTASSIRLELGADSNEGQEAYLDMDLVMGYNTHILLMSGVSRLKSESDVYETRSRSIGFSSDYDALFVFGFDDDYWGNPETLETNTQRFKIGTNLGNWFLQYVYEDRKSKLRTNRVVFKQGSLVDIPVVIEFNSTGKGIDVSFYGFYPLTINVSYIEYEYERDLNIISRHPRFAKSTFPSTSLDAATGLESWRRSADISYSLDWGIAGISGSQSESEIDSSLSTTGSLYMIWDISQQWSTGFTVGESRTDDSEDVIRFIRISVSHQWQ